MLQKIIDKFNESYSAFDSSLASFNQPNVKQISNLLELEKIAQEHGSKNRPSKSRKTKDSSAKSIDHMMDLIINQGKEGLINYLSSSLELSKNQREIDNDAGEVICQRALSALHQTAKIGVIELFSLKADILRGERDLNSFRQKNNIEGPARRPDSIAAGWGLIAIAAVFETILNAITLRDAHPSGLAGVGLETLLFTAVNISLSCIFGVFILRNLHHINIVRKFTAAMFGIFFLGLIVGINLSFAHYRDALMSFSRQALNLNEYLSQSAQLMGVAIENMLGSPIALYDSKSYMLFFIGCLLAFAATWKSYSLDDPYPGYGKKDKQQKNQADQYLSMVSDFYEELDEIAQDGIQDLRGVNLTQTGAQRTVEKRSADNERLKAKYESWLNTVESCGQSLYSIYQETNEEHRTQPRPPCFDIEYELPLSAHKLPKLGSKIKPSGEVPSNKRLIKRIESALSDYLDHFKTLENLSPQEQMMNEIDGKTNAIDSLGKKYNSSRKGRTNG